jgi:hypothetical protein
MCRLLIHHHSTSKKDQNSLNCLLAVHSESMHLACYHHLIWIVEHIGSSTLSLMQSWTGCVWPGVWFDKNECCMFCTLGMEYGDDFMLISPLNLCLTTKILPEKVLFLYSSAETAILMLHEEKQHIIDEMEELRCEWNMMHDDHNSD